MALQRGDDEKHTHGDELSKARTAAWRWVKRLVTTELHDKEIAEIYTYIIAINAKTAA